jgi:hypothetical protein
MRRGDKADLIGTILDERYPDPPIPLDHRDPYTLLVAVALSAQTTDKKVNQVTPALFERADTPEKMLALGPDEILGLIREVGLAPTKAKNLWLARAHRRVRRRGPRLGVPRVAAGRRPQDGQRGDVAGVRPPRPSPSTPTSTALPPAGASRTARPSSAPNAISRPSSRSRRGIAGTCRSSTSAASSARPSATTCSRARSVRGPRPRSESRRDRRLTRTPTDRRRGLSR